MKHGEIVRETTHDCHPRLHWSSSSSPCFGRSSDAVASGQSVQAAVATALADDEAALQQMLLRADGSLQPSIVPFINDQQATTATELADAAMAT